jgi:hypothetical protein
VVVSIGAALKIYEHNHRASAVLTIKEILIPSTDSKDAGLMTSVLIFDDDGSYDKNDDHDDDDDHEGLDNLNGVIMFYVMSMLV